MRINNNISAMNTYSRLTSAQGAQSKSLEKLSSGLRINRAGDDAAGLAISEKMRGQIKGLNQSVRNAQDGISLIQTAEGALNETHSILNRMRELAVQSANDTNTNSDREEIQKEMNQLSQEVTRISANTEFNTQKLLTGGFDGKKLHIGANESQAMDVSIADMGSKALGVGGVKSETVSIKGLDGVKIRTDDASEWTISFATLKTDDSGATQGVVADDTAKTLTVTLGQAADTTNAITTKYSDLQGAIQTALTTASSTTKMEIILDEDITVGDAVIFSADGNTVTSKNFGGIDVFSQKKADEAITTIDNAITAVSAERSKLGAVQNRLDHTINNLTATSENLSAAESRIRDVDMAKEMMEFTKNNILNQASTAMLAQANQMPQGVLQLLG